MPDNESGPGVWTDFGGVLTPAVDQTFASFSERTGVPTHALKQAMLAVGRAHGTDAMGVLDIPLLDEATWAAELEAELSETYGLICNLSDFGERWFNGRPPNRVWVRFLESLRERGVFVGLLSNMPPAWEPLWRRMVDPGLFDAVVCSHAVGARKPEPEIFRIAAARAGRAPADCVLVDDLPDNCAGARSSGWHAVEFTDNEATIERVTTLLDRADLLTGGVR